MPTTRLAHFHPDAIRIPAVAFDRFGRLVEPSGASERRLRNLVRSNLSKVSKLPVRLRMSKEIDLILTTAESIINPVAA